MLKVVLESINDLLNTALQTEDKEKSLSMVKEGITAKFDEINTLFEGAVNEKVNTFKKQFDEQYKKDFSELTSKLEEKLEGYLDNAHKEFLKEQKESLVAEARVAVVEEFYQGIKKVFNEQSIEVDADQKQHIDNLNEQVKELEDKLNSKVNENLELQKDIESRDNDIKAKDFELAFEGLSKDLSETDKARFRNLVEGFEIDEKLEDRMKVILESNFKKEKDVETKTEEPKSEETTVVKEDEDVKPESKDDTMTINELFGF